MRKDVDWEAWGTPKMPQRLLNIHKAEDGTMAYGECGGSCGGCQPVKEKMFVEPSTCTDPTSTEAVARQSIPAPSAKTDQKGKRNRLSNFLRRCMLDPRPPTRT
ncbi:hypothetical protein OS493_006171 [Desmophyllum pertusum]|uniref:GON domain-containing protein n=1 Tax=Desmophyllum pertusum TaxID=174260 RepID=A0A9X0A511_9CNID|nr:hypothetical protein OS493_006171 [Desmophyllum pertusum]